MIKFLNELHLGVNIDFIREFVARTHNGVVSRMAKTGGYCIPEFVVRGKRLYFALDNIDYTEDTPFGQNSTYGTFMVIWQEVDDDENSVLVNPELDIPKRSSPVEIEIEYLKAPEMNPQAIRFSNVQLNDNEVSNRLLKEYNKVFRTWALSSHLSNCATLPETDLQTTGIEELFFNFFNNYLIILIY